MNLWAVTMVRNEDDVIEAFVRHNLAFVDGLLVLDHRSSDATPQVLARLKDEGLPLWCVHDADAAFYQGDRISRLARECFQSGEADFVMALDADEFIRAPSRARIEEALAGVPPGHYAAHEWRSYVPLSFDAGFGPQSLRMRLRVEPAVRSKVIIPRSFLDRPECSVSEGSHWIVDTRTGHPLPHVALRPDISALAHCPVRSARQFEAKARHGYAAVQAAGADKIGIASHWREFQVDLSSGMALSDERLRLTAANYCLPRDQWLPLERIELVEDPVDLQLTTGKAG